jgi:hypothetical protein
MSPAFRTLLQNCQQFLISSAVGLSLLLLPNGSRAQTGGPSSLLRVSPPVIQPSGGKLPTSVTLAVLENCDDPKSVDLSNDKLLVTGSGLSLSTSQNANKCVIQSVLSIDPSTPAGTYSIIVEDKNTGKPVGFTDLSVLDTSAAPIPPGLAPEVDVIWNVLSENDCSDAFGERVAQSMYCVELKIGNNSGHPLQLAGVGFTKSLKALNALNIPQVTIGNTSYATTRAVLVESQVWSTRNLVANSIAGAGLIMAGFAPFYHHLNAKANFATGSAIVSGPLQQAFNLIFPDPIVTQLKSLDDDSFRDNMIIQNNQHIKTMVFVEKQNMTLPLNELEHELTNADSGEAMKELMAAAKTKEETRSAQVMAQSLAVMQTNFKSTIKNSSRPTFWKGQQNPLLVDIALGNLVIVGDEIQYLQRVQIQSSVSNAGVTVTVNPSAPQVPISATQSFTATVTNDLNGSGVNWTLSGPNCQAATCGTLTNQTTTTVTYTAPGSQPAPNNTTTLTATAKADSTKSGNATVTVISAPPPISVAITPNPAQPVTHGGAAVAFNTVVRNDSANAGVTWSVSGAGCTGATCGTLTNSTPSAVSFTPPATVPNPSTVGLKATSNSNSRISDTVNITIN